MTDKETKEALNEYRSLVKAYDDVLRIISELEDKATATGSPTPRADKVLSSLPQSARYEDDIINKADLEQVLAESVKDIQDARQRVEQLIALAPTPTQRRLLNCRYILGMQFITIAKVLRYSEDHVFTIHRKAIKAISKKT